MWTMPVEIEGAIPFEVDDVHITYESAHAHRFWQALVAMLPVFTEFRSRYTPEGVFYSYAYPEPLGFATTPVQPAEARWSGDYGEFLLPYEIVRQAADPTATLLTFLQTTYDAAADTAGWDRAGLERPTGEPGSSPLKRPVPSPEELS